MDNEKFIPTLREYLDDFFHKITADAYFKEIIRFLKANPKAALYDYSKVMEYIEILRKKYAPATIGKRVSVLKIYYDYLIQTGRRKDNPARAIQLRDYKNKPIQLQDLFSEKELENILELGKDQKPFLVKRNQIIISLLIYQGLRLEEIANLKTTDIDLEKAQIQIKETVQTKQRVLPLQARQILLFHIYLQQDRLKVLKSGSDTAIFILNRIGEPFPKYSMFDVIRFYRNQITKNLTAGTIRRSVIANLLNKGTDLRIVQEFAGHKNLDSTQRYKEKGLKALQTAIEKHHPLK